MKTHRNRRRFIVIAAGGILLAAACQLQAASFDLTAAAFDKSIDGQLVRMWGFGLTGGPISSPGPLLTVPPGDATLTITLTNALDVPVSLIIPGQTASFAPVYHAAGPYAGRVRSLTQEVAPGATGGYTWTGLQPGTYLYHSGTQMQVQVQMGLYGAVKHDFAAQQAYSNSASAYHSDVVLLYSEIDPLIHDAVKNGTYGPDGAITSTVSYWPTYFLINGEPYAAGQPPIPAGTVNQRLLIRFLNAGLQSHVPVLHNYYGQLLAEDGNLLPFAREQYEVLLAAGKTCDVLVQPTAAGIVTIYDRTLDLTTGAQWPGGMLVNLSVSAAQQRMIGRQLQRLAGR